MRRAFLISSVFTLGAGTFVACSGFSSSDTNESNDASAVDGSTLADDSQAVGEDANAIGDGGVTDGEPVDSGRLRVFVTSSVYLGDFQGSGESGSSLCAAVAGGGSWKAWLSTRNISARTVVSNAGPWWSMDGEKLAAYVSDAGVLEANSIFWTEDGGSIPGTTEVWTGTYWDGGTVGGADTTCDNWKVGAPSPDGGPKRSGRFGSAGTTGPSWTDVGNGPCESARHLYCFESP